MSHAIYQTPALILGTIAMRESNKLAILYTEDFGLIYVAVQSVRAASSKMKSHLQTYSLVDVDLVRGRDIWRLTGIHEKLSSLSYVHTQWYPFIEKVSSMVQRLCPGEEVNHELWSDIEQLFRLVTEDRDHVDVLLLEIIFIARLLNNLGYWSGNEIVVTSEILYSPEVVSYVSLQKREVIKRINRGLEISQL